MCICPMYIIYILYSVHFHHIATFSTYFVSQLCELVRNHTRSNIVVPVKAHTHCLLFNIVIIIILDIFYLMNFYEKVHVTTW